MKATEELKIEHQAIKMMLKILEKVSTKLDDGKAVNPQHLQEMVEFIQIFADRCHHGKEEDLLFQEMIKTGIPKQGGPIAVMLSEHQSGRNLVKNIKTAVNEYQAGGKTAGQVFSQNARSYIDLLSQHIDKEDNILYPMADNCLSSTTQEKLCRDFARLETERIGPGKHQAFHQMLKTFQKIYL